MANDETHHPTLFHPAVVLREVESLGLKITIADILTGIAMFGATGSGKTSGPGMYVILAFLARRFGGIILCAKPGEREQFMKWCAATHRTDDVIVFDVSGKNRFNFLNWESAHAGPGGGQALLIVALFEEILSALKPKLESGGEGQFWEKTFSQLCFQGVNLLQLGGYEILVASIVELINTAPLSPAQARDPEWQQQSDCYRILSEAEERTREADPETRADFEIVRAYFLREFPSLSEKTRSIISIMVTSFALPLTTRPLRKLFSTDTTVTPEDTFSGKLIVVDISTQEHREVGRIAALILKYCWQRACMRREAAPAGSYLRPVFLWADEAAENFLSRNDSEFQAVARASAAVTVYIAQNINQYRKHLGGDDHFEAFMANLQIKIFCQNVGPTNKWASELLGEHWTKIESTNVSQGAEGNRSSGLSIASQKRYLIEPSVFTTLKRGGVAYDRWIEAIIFKGGALFPGNKPYLILPFRQPENQ